MRIYNNLGAVCIILLNKTNVCETCKSVVKSNYFIIYMTLHFVEIFVLRSEKLLSEGETIKLFTMMTAEKGSTGNLRRKGLEREGFVFPSGK